MNNEVVIEVVADDKTELGFAKARLGARKTASDIEGEFKKSGPKVGGALGGGMLEGLKTSLPSFAQFGGVAGGIMAPTIGAAVSAGVFGVAGGAGIVGGLMLAAKSPAVQAAGAAMKETIGNDLKNAASSFVPVALTSIAKVQKSFREVLPDIRSIFQDSSKFVGPLLDGITDGAKHIIGGIQELVSNAQPVFDAFGRAFANIGDSVGEMFSNLSDNAEGSASAVDDLSEALVNVVRVTGGVINGLVEMKEKADSFDGAIDKQRAHLEDSVSWLDLTADGYKKGSEAADLYRRGLIGASDQSNNYTDYLKKQKDAAEGVTAATNDQTSAMKDLQDQIQSEIDPLFALIKGQQSVKKAQDNYNKALEKHGRNSAEAKEAMANLGEAAFNLNGKVAGAAGKFDGKLTPAMRTALRNAKLSTAQIDALEGQLRSAADAADAWSGTYVQRFKTIYSTTGRETIGQDGHRTGGYQAHGGITGSASGASPAGLTWVGEQGPELMTIPAGTRVHSNPDSMRMAAGQGGGGDGTPLIVQFVMDGEIMAEKLLDPQRDLVKRKFQGNVQLAYGR